MSYGPPRKPPSGGRIPSLVKKVSSTTTTSITTTSLGRSTASSARPGSCSTGVPCGSGSTSRSRLPEPTRSSSYGRQRPVTAPQATCPGGASGQRMPGPPRDVRSSGYGKPRPTSATAGRPTPAGRRQMETVTSVSSMTRDCQGTETFTETEERVIHPTPVSRIPSAGASRRPSGTCPGSGSSAGRPAGIPRPSGISRPTATARPPARSQYTPSAAPSKITTRSSTTVLSDGTRIQESSKRTEKGPAQKPISAPRRPVSSSASEASVSTTPSTGAIPKVKTVTSKASRTSMSGGKRTTTTQEITKITPALPEGRYVMGLKHPPHTKEGKYKKFSSPDGIRRRMDADMPKGIKSSLMPPEYKGVQDIKKLTALKPYKDTVSCAMQIGPGRKQAPESRPSPWEATAFLDETIEPEYGSPYRSPPAARAPVSEDRPTILEQEVEQQLMHAAALSPGRTLRVSGSRKSPAKPHVIITEQGPVTATEQIISERRIEKSPGLEKVSRHMTGIERSGCGAIQTELDTQTIESGGGLPKRGDMAKETISVKSSVAVAPGGIKETTTTVIYETTGKKSPEKKINISPEQVERLIEEEAIDVNKTLKLKPLDLKIISPKSYTTRKREHHLKLNYTSLLELEQSVVIPEPSPDQEQEEAQPEMVASIMYTEEQGLGLESQPTQMYEMLFPKIQEAAMMTVNSVAPAPLQDILVPAQLPANFHAQGATAEVESATACVDTAGETKPTGNVFTETDGAKPSRKNVAKRRGRKKTTEVALLTQEAPPWADEDMKPIVEIVGAPITQELVAESLEDKYDEEKEPQEPEYEPFEYMLQLEPPTHISRVQLRGSTRPPWFQGYYLALPDIPNLVKVSKTADDALDSAWRAVQPNYFPDDSIISI